MGKDVLLLGPFSSGKSAFINMLLGVSIIPEMLQSTNLPVIKIHHADSADVYLRKNGECSSIGSLDNIPKTWDSFEYAGLSIPGHPLLEKGLVLWDTPGINTTNKHHQEHLELFLDKNQNRFAHVLFFISGNIESTDIDFLKKWSAFNSRLILVENIHEIMDEKECRLLESSVKKEVRKIGNIPVELLYIGEVCREFNTLSVDRRKRFLFVDPKTELSNWKKYRIDFRALIKKHQEDIIGLDLFVFLDDWANKQDDAPIDFSSLSIDDLEEYAEDGNAEAQCYLAEKLGESDEPKWLYWMETSANSGFPRAQAFYGYYLIFAENPDFKKGIALLKKAAEKGEPLAHYYLAICYSDGKGVKKDDKAGFEHYLEAAKEGVPDAMHSVGACFEDGIGTTTDMNKAIHWYRKGSDAGDSGSQVDLGRHLIIGDNIQKDESEGFELLKKSAEKKNRWALFNLGNCYEDGIVVPSDKETAFNYYKSSADLGYERSAYKVGLFYQSGIAVQQNLTKAIEWYEKAPTIPEACISLAAIYLMGSEPDVEHIVELLERNLNGLEDIEHVIETFVTEVGAQLEDGCFFFLSHSISSLKYHNASKSFLGLFDGKSKGNWILYYDSTQIGTGGDGFAIGNKGLAWRNDIESPAFFSFTSKILSSITYTEENQRYGKYGCIKLGNNKKIDLKNEIGRTPMIAYLISILHTISTTKIDS